MDKPVLDISNLEVSRGENKKVLDQLSLCIKPGSTHVIMGPNGCGKSTLASVIAGVGLDELVVKGSIRLHNQEISDMSADQRACMGLFLAFQYPVALPGVPNAYMIRTAVNRVRENRLQSPLDSFDFLRLMKAKMRQVGLSEDFLNRGTNDGFSGGEKKRNEILQMLLLEPDLVILDEIDSGLDVDALRNVASCVESMRDERRSFLIITHYQRLLEYIKPDWVHVIKHGKIVETGSHELARKLDQEGFSAT